MVMGKERNMVITRELSGDMEDLLIIVWVGVVAWVTGCSGLLVDGLMAPDTRPDVRDTQFLLIMNNCNQLNV